MSTIDANNPTTWSYPTNYNGISCYADSALWALLYKDSDFYNLVNNFSTENIKEKHKFDSTPKIDNESKKNISGLPIECVEDKYTLLRQNILDFYNGITSQPKQILQKFVINILEILTTCFPTNRWNKQQCDANDFFNILINIFSLNNVNENITQEESQKYKYEDNTNSTSEPTKNMLSIINILTNPNDIDFKQIKSLSNILIVPYNDETMVEGENIINGKITKTKQTILEYKSNSEIKSAIFNFKRMGLHFNKDTNKNIQIKIYDPVNFSLKIGNLMLNSIIVHQGIHVDGGHYICYFKYNNEWFLMDDTRDISKVSGKIYMVDGLLTNCTTLVYSKASQDELANTDDGYAYDLFKSSDGNLVEEIQSELKPLKLSSSAKKLSSPAIQKQAATNNSSIQVANKCEQYEQEWLDLFIEENDAKGYKTEIKTTDDGTEIEVTDRDGVKTSVLKTDKNCTFTPQGSTTDEETETTVEETIPEITLEKFKTEFDVKKLFETLNKLNNNNLDEFKNGIQEQLKTIEKEYIDANRITILDMATEEKEKNIKIQTGLIIFGEYTKILNILNDESNIEDKKKKFVELKTKLESNDYLNKLIQDINLRLQASRDIQNKKKNKINNSKNNPLSEYLSDQTVYDVANISVVDITKIDLKIYKNKNIIIYKKNGNEPIYYMVFTNDKNERKLVNLKTNKVLTKNHEMGRVIDIGKANFNGGTRRRNIKFEKSKTRKFIRYKNKLKTNKLKTNKLKTNKLKTNKLKTNKLKTRKLKLNKLKTNKLKTNKLRKA